MIFQRRHLLTYFSDLLFIMISVITDQYAYCIPQSVFQLTKHKHKYTDSKLFVTRNYFLCAEVKSEPGVKKEKEEPMEVEEDYSEVMNDPEFLQSVLENLPGVDPHDEGVLKAVGSLSKDKKKDDDKSKKSGGDKSKK